MIELICSKDETRSDEEIISNYLYQCFDEIIDFYYDKIQEEYTLSLYYVPLEDIGDTGETFVFDVFEAPCWYTMSFPMTPNQELSDEGRKKICHKLATEINNLYITVVKDERRILYIDIARKYIVSTYLTFGK